MKTDKKLLGGRKLWILEIAFGMALLAGVFFYSARADVIEAESRLRSTVEYMKGQCNASSTIWHRRQRVCSVCRKAFP